MTAGCLRCFGLFEQGSVHLPMRHLTDCNINIIIIISFDVIAVEMNLMNTFFTSACVFFCVLSVYLPSFCCSSAAVTLHFNCNVLYWCVHVVFGFCIVIQNHSLFSFHTHNNLMWVCNLLAYSVYVNGVVCNR